MVPGTLEHELIEIFASTAHERNREIVIGYYGWCDGRTHTLAEIGARYSMTRERTRQICAKLVRRKDAAALAAPVTDRTLRFLAERLPAPVAVLEEALVREGLTAAALGLAHVQTAAALLGRHVPFAIADVGGRKLVVRPEHAEAPGAIVELAKKEIYYHGLSTVAQIQKAVNEKMPGAAQAALVTETLQLIDGFAWLDQPRGWFRLVSLARHGLPKAIEKILAAAPRVKAEELLAAVSRNRRMWHSPPPAEVLLQFCRQMPGVRVEGEYICADPARDWRDVLTGVEAKLVEILGAHGPILERNRLEDLCVESGMNRFSFHAFIACSPVIAQYGHSIYGLLGAEASPERVQALLDKRRAERMPRRVLDGHGQSDDGRIWLSYRLSKAASTYAVITVPAVFKEAVSGRFELLTPDGRSVGTLAARDGRAWGLGAFLRKSGARVDDHVRITFDLAGRTAVVSFDNGTGPAAASA